MCILPSLKYKIFLKLNICFILFVFSCSKVYAQKIASFDPYFLILFHPLMADFDQSVHRFLKPKGESFTKLEWNIQREKLLRELRNQKQSKQNKNIIGFYSKLPQLKKRYPVEKDYNKEYQKLRNEYLGLNEDPFLTKEYVKFYYNDKESLAIFSRIWRDIRVVMAQLQQEHEYLFYLPIYKDQVQVAKKPYNLNFSGTQLGASAYLKYTTNPQKLAKIELDDQFENIEKMRDLLYPHLDSKFVLYGLRDVSAILLKKILKKNQIEDEISDIVSNVYEMWLSKNNKDNR
ncbi:MAG: hypothetical protein KC646_12520 [Candidatus Cloacimonetes bacterium]|nr:hypothetical protein [Candidatus Cloacimonadota bacterium]